MSVAVGVLRCVAIASRTLLCVQHVGPVVQVTICRFRGRRRRQIRCKVMKKTTGHYKCVWTKWWSSSDCSLSKPSTCAMHSTDLLYHVFFGSNNQNMNKFRQSSSEYTWHILVLVSFLLWILYNLIKILFVQFFISFFDVWSKLYKANNCV